MYLVLLLAIHLVGLVGYTLFLRKSALGTINKKLLAALMQTGIFLPALILFFSGQISFDFSYGQWFMLIVSGIFVAGLHITTIKALQYLEASVFTIIYNLRLFLTTIFGLVFLNELPNGVQITGGLLIFLSILVLNLHKDNHYKSKPVLFGFLATLWFSAHATLEKFNVTAVGSANFMFWAGIIALIILWLLVLLDKSVTIKSLKPVFKDKHTLQLVGLRTMSAWGYTVALPFGTLAVINYVSGLGVALIVLFGIVLLKETDNIKQKVIAVAVAMAGLTCILIGRF